MERPRLAFTVTRDDVPVIERSELSMVVDNWDLAEHIEQGFPKQSLYEVNRTYPVRGVHALATDRCNGLRLTLRHRATNTEYDLELRAYDDAVAFRFVILGRAAQSRVPEELTTFTLPEGSTVWSHDLRGHYEGMYEKKDVSAFHEGEWAAPPVTFKLPDAAGYASITEASLVNYSGMALEADGRRGFRVGLAHRQPVSHPFELRYSKEDIERLSHPAAITGEIVTPWRVVMIGKDLNALVNCDVVTALCPPPDPKLFPQGASADWLRPGRAVWRYLDMTETRGDPGADPDLPRATPATSPATTRAARRPVSLDEMKQWSRLAGQLGFEYNILEGFWRQFSEAQLRELVDYSRQRNVRILVWVGSRSLRDEPRRKQLFQTLHDVGVAGLKVDFFDHEHKEMIDLYQAILRDAAEHELVLDFHGANKPTGESRTWPNELVREAIKGMEARQMPSRAVHETTLPFTRFLAGHAEYTGMLFNQRRGDTTAAHQIAVPIVFTAPLLTFGAHPQNILSHPAVELIKSIPSVWDETIVLAPSEIGEIAIFARRKGEVWFLAALNGAEARSAEISLSFLATGAWRAMIVKDAKPQAATTQPTDQVEVERDVTFRADQTIRIDLPAGGGYVVRFTKN
jgi:alpha-glucosidase